MNKNIVKALCNETRLNLIQCLSYKSLTVTEMIEKCGLSQSAVSQHLTKLKKANIVSTKKSGKEIYYSLTDKSYSKVSTLITNLSNKKQ